MKRLPTSRRPWTRVWTAACLVAVYLACGVGGTAGSRGRLVKISHRRIGASSTAETWVLAMRTHMFQGAQSGEDDGKQAACGPYLRRLPFYSCWDIHSGERADSGTVEHPTDLLRGVGWPCSDRFVHTRKRTRHFLDGFLLLPNASIASSLLSGQLRCYGSNVDIDSQVYSAHVYTSLANLTQIKQSLSGNTCVDINDNHNKNPNTTSASPHHPRSHHANPIPALSLLELSHAEIMSMLPGMKEILNPVVDGVMQPVVNVVANQLGPDLNAPLCEDMAHGINEELPGDVAAMLEQTLTANLTNMLTDSVTMLLSDSLTESLTKALGPYLDESITEAAQPRLHTAMHNILSHTVPNRLNRDVPALLIRSLKIGLTQTLTRSVTHSVVPALATALAHTNKQDIFCYMCYTYHVHCRLCHYSPQASYYNQYYSGYYSDYCEFVLIF